MADTEIEIQTQVDDSAVLRAFLEANAQFLGEAHQLDEYYSPPDRDFLSVRPVNEWLRLRDADGKASMNYKNWYQGEDGRSQYCDEYETPLADIDQARKILFALKHRLLTKVDKTRASWRYQDYEVSLDHVEGLGDFVEVEFKGDVVGRNPSDINTQMIAFLKEHGCGKIRRNFVGYPFALLFPESVIIEEL